MNKGGGLQERIVAMMKEKGSQNTLWTREEVMAELNLEKTQAENALYNAFRKPNNPLLHRHKEKDADGNARYALHIKEENRDIYTPSKGKGTKNPVIRGLKKSRKKSRLPTAKELRKMFSEAQNHMAILEDAVLAVTERYEEIDKAATKLKDLYE